MSARPAAILLAAALAACSRPGAPWGEFEPEARRVAAGRDPSLHVLPSGKILLLSAEARGGDRGLVLRTSEDGGDSYPGARPLDRAGDVEAHGEGRPLLRIGPRLEEYVVWSERDGEAKRLWLTRSVDYGHSFSAPVEIAPAGAATFFDLAVDSTGTLALAWLAYVPAPGARSGTASIEVATSGDGGATWSAPARVAIDVCPCCRPRLAAASDGAWLLAWRGVEEGDVRDVFVARSTDRLATVAAAVRVAADGWKLDGCPHSGASIAIASGRAWVAWATGASGEMRSFVASSPAGALAFGERSGVGGALRDVDHPELAVAAGGRLWIGFQARAERESFAPMRAWLAPVSARGAGVPLAAPAGKGSALYPALAPIGDDRLLLAWTDSAADGFAVTTARVRVASAGEGSSAQIPDVSAPPQGVGRQSGG